MSFDAERFASTPTVRELNSLKKNELLQLAQYYELTADAALSKSQVKEIVLKHLIDEELITPVDETAKEIGTNNGMSGEELLQLKRLEFQEREKEREAQLRLKELDIKERELSLQVQLKELEVRATRATTVAPETNTSFDVGKHVKFVPVFHEAEVDKYFLHFEKVARSLKWPEEEWTLLLQSSLIGKAREVYSALSIDDSAQYDVVKSAILKAYELVPEAYRQKFRNTTKTDNQTYVEFARVKESLFDRWCTSKDIDEDFVKLRQLVLVEEFKNCVSRNVKTYLDEKKAENLKEAAVLADDYVLTHKGLSSQRTSTTSALNQNASSFIPTNPGQRRYDLRPNGRNHQQNGRGNWKRNVPPLGPECYYCKKKGHVMSDCWHLRNATSGSTKSTMTTVQASKLLPDGKPKTACGFDRAVDEYTPFISKGIIHAPGSNSPMPINILRDTGANPIYIVGEQASHGNTD